MRDTSIFIYNILVQKIHFRQKGFQSMYLHTNISGISPGLRMLLPHSMWQDRCSTTHVLIVVAVGENVFRHEKLVLG